MTTRSSAVGATVLLAGLVLAGCSGAPSPSLALVAGGGEDPGSASATEVSLVGQAVDLDARDGIVAVLLHDGADRSVVLVEDGAVATRAVPETMAATRVALGADGAVFVADADGIAALDDAGSSPVVATPDRPADAAAGGQDVPVEEGEIADITVDAAGDLLWLNAFVAGDDPADAPVLAQVKRLADGSVSVVAGAGQASFSDEEFEQAEVDPPAGVDATDLPLRTTARLASDREDGLYLAGYSSILRVEENGSVERVASAGSRETPEEPLSDRASADGFGGPWLGNSLAADGGIVVVQEDNTAVSGDGFDWSGELGAAQELVDELNAEDVEQLTLVITRGEAVSVLAHAEAIALDGSTLYAVGTVDGAESVVVSTDLADVLD